MGRRDEDASEEVGCLGTTYHIAPEPVLGAMSVSKLLAFALQPLHISGVLTLLDFESILVNTAVGWRLSRSRG